MRTLKRYWRTTFDVREGERLRTLLMSLYLLLVLTVHYVLKPLSEGMFVAKFEPDKLPHLTILIAVAGGFIMSLYTRAAVGVSLQAAVSWAMGFTILCLIAFWWLVGQPWKWVLYAFNTWATLFGAVVVAQGYVVAANVFTSREAKRVYGVLGLGAAGGSLIGAALEAGLVERLGRHLLLVSVGLVGLAYLAFRLVITQQGVSLTHSASEREKQPPVSVRHLFAEIGRHRHLTVITLIIAFVFIVDELVKFQWKAAVKAAYEGPAISEFLGKVYFSQNLITFLFQFLLTGALVSRLGVGGTLKFMPASITLASIGSFFWPGVVSGTATKLVEGASRYSFNKTSMELLYLPLPAELRNRTKAFMDVFMDRAARGVAGALLIVLGWVGLQNLRTLALLVVGLTVAWLLLSRRVQSEYLATIRKRLDARRLELENTRVAVADSALVALLERYARGDKPRQACYALSLLAQAPGYRTEPLLVELARSRFEEVRTAVYEHARSLQFPGLLESALTRIRTSGPQQCVDETRAAVRYAFSAVSDPVALASELLASGNPAVTSSVLDAIPELPQRARELVTLDWVSVNVAAKDPECRALAALAISVRGDHGTEALHHLLRDPSPKVAAAACRAAGALKNRAYLHALMTALGDPLLRGAAIEALTAFGGHICGALGDQLEDPGIPETIRRHVPRVLRSIPEQRSVDVLIRSMNEPNLRVRAAVLRALNRLHESAPALDFSAASVTRQILEEARLYYQLNTALEPLRQRGNRRTACGLLAASIEERIAQALERLFRLLGLRYPPMEIYAAYLAVHHGRKHQFAAAMDFLENVLDRDLRRTLLPLLEDSVHMLERGRELFGFDERTPEEAIRTLIRSGDLWLATCAIAAATELRLTKLVPDIAEVARGTRADINRVALDAQTSLA